MCKFCVTDITFLGHRTTPERIATGPQNIGAIRNMAPNQL